MTKKTTKTKKTEPKTVNIRLMFKHREIGIKGNALNIFYEVEKKASRYILSDKIHLYARIDKTMRGSKLANPMCGGVYVVEALDKEAKSIYPGTAKYEGRYHDHDLLTEWQALDHATRDALTAIQTEKKEQKYDYLLKRLSPLQRAYQQMRGSQRNAFLVRVIKCITGA